MKICYSFSWPSIDLISKVRRLDPTNPGRFNSLVISSIYHVAFRLFSEEQLMVEISVLLVMNNSSAE